MAPNTSQSGGSSSLAPSGQASCAAADQPAIDLDRVRPVERDRLFRRRGGRERIGERDACRHRRRGARDAAARPAPAPPRIRRDRSGPTNTSVPAPSVGGNRFRMCEGVAHFAQRHEAEDRRQIERGRIRRARLLSRFQRHAGSRLAPSNCYNYKLWRGRPENSTLEAEKSATATGPQADSRNAACRFQRHRPRDGDFMAEKPRQILICSCEDTMPLDARRSRAAAGARRWRPRASSAAPSSSGSAQAAASGEPLTVACTQEAPLFAEVAGRGVRGPDRLRQYPRDRPAGRREAGKAGPKMAALLACRGRDARRSVRQPRQRRRRADLWPRRARDRGRRAAQGSSRRHRAADAAAAISRRRASPSFRW